MAMVRVHVRTHSFWLNRGQRRCSRARPGEAQKALLLWGGAAAGGHVCTHSLWLNIIKSKANNKIKGDVPGHGLVRQGGRPVLHSLGDWSQPPSCLKCNIKESEALFQDNFW